MFQPMAKKAKKKKKPKLRPKHFAKVYEQFQASISRYDCGKRCAPLNGGDPVCCTTDAAVPIAHDSEWRLLKGRTDLWHPFKPFDAATRDIVEEMSSDCRAIECKGARFCERDNRTLACRAFPFFADITREGDFLGLGYFWVFEDRCWVISNLRVVNRRFVKEFVEAHEYLFEKDPQEKEYAREQSAAARRVFSRWNRPFPLIGRDGGYFKVLPHGGGVVKARLSEFRAHGPYKSEAAYRKAVKEEEAARLRTQRAS